LKIQANHTIDQFCAFQKAWDQAIPATLLKHDPVTIVNFVRIATKAGGASARELQEQLELLQSAASKLTKTLFEEGWITKLPNPNEDRRSELLLTTAQGRVAISNIESCLNSTIAKPPPRSGRRKLRHPPDFIPLLASVPESPESDPE
jgi:hypothetical protein